MSQFLFKVVEKDNVIVLFQVIKETLLFFVSRDVKRGVFRKLFRGHSVNLPGCNPRLHILYAKVKAGVRDEPFGDIWGA